MSKYSEIFEKDWEGPIVKVKHNGVTTSYTKRYANIVMVNGWEYEEITLNDRVESAFEVFWNDFDIWLSTTFPEKQTNEHLRHIRSRNTQFYVFID